MIVNFDENNFINYANKIFGKKRYIDEVLKFIYKKFGKTMKVGSMYNLIANSFNRAYFCKNLIKNKIAMELIVNKRC